jgi:hypothetical protein
LLAKFLDSKGDTENIDAFLHCVLRTYHDTNEDEQMVNKNILTIAILYHLEIKKLSRARASIVATLNAKHASQAATPIPFTWLSTMLV